ncbi:hypothetical protein JMJ35_005479 [Cladonia borealis]|uniref:Uncharacterized protein n=1 Tax=Cladonia borealis TaxID=184061 RepID=A0AA39UAE3_9LECA|nr:hypothetical protein JMJ35_005479 [Cladonia borealis]
MPRKKPEPWSVTNTEEIVIAVYFGSRLVEYRTAVASKLIEMRFNTHYDELTIRYKIKIERQLLGENGPDDFYDKDARLYHPDKVDAWLSRLIPDTGKLERLLGIKDNKIVDEKVLEILKPYV